MQKKRNVKGGNVMNREQQNELEKFEKLEKMEQVISEVKQVDVNGGLNELVMQKMEQVDEQVRQMPAEEGAKKRMELMNKAIMYEANILSPAERYVVMNKVIKVLKLLSGLRIENRRFGLDLEAVKDKTFKQIVEYVTDKVIDKGVQTSEIGIAQFVLEIDGSEYDEVIAAVEQKYGHDVQTVIARLK